MPLLGSLAGCGNPLRNRANLIINALEKLFDFAYLLRLGALLAKIKNFLDKNENHRKRKQQ